MIKRPLAIITISYIIGILIGLYFKINTALLFFIGFIILVVIYFCFVKYFNSRAKFTCIKNLSSKSHFLILIVSMFVCILSFVNIRTLENKFAEIYKLDNEQVVIEGIIVDVKKSSNYYNKYVIKVDSLSSYKTYESIHIILNVKKSKNNINSRLKCGDHITCSGILEKPSTARNYKGFDYSQYLKTKKIYMTCKTENSNIDVIKSKSNLGYKVWISNLRNSFKSSFNKLLDTPKANIANAIILGYSDEVDAEQKEVFTEANLVHILAISGMHVGYIVVFLNFGLKNFSKRKSKYICIILLAIFADLTGNSPSVERAVIMSMFMISSKLFFRKSDTINNIAISCLMLLILNPYNILNLGFQLSFLGTVGIVLFYEKIMKLIGTISLTRIKKDYKPCIHCVSKIIEKIKSIIAVGISANLLMFPVIVNSSNSFSLVFIISTILVTPVLGVMISSGYTTIILSLLSIYLAKVSAFVLNVSINIFSFIAEFSSKISFLRYTVATPPIWSIVVYYVLILYLFFYFKKSHIKIIYKLIVVAVMLSIVIKIVTNANRGLKLYFIDVGQGDSTLIITESNKTILIDGGGSESSDYDIGESILVPYLLDRRVTNIDYVIFSHFDSDHCKGLFTVMEKLKVKNAVISEQGSVSDNYNYFVKLARSKKVNIIKVKAGDRIGIDKSTFIDVLWPRKNLIQENVLNNNSIVCKLNYSNISILFTGDIEEIAEKQIVSLYGSSNILNSNILKVAHHGSKTSSIYEFVSKVNPKIALIGVGENNKFGHPNDKVIERFENLRDYYL